MDTKFSIAIHCLIMIAGSDTPLTSAMLASSVGTNPSFVRRIIGCLKQGGIIESHQGVGGFALLVDPKELSLLRIYRAVEEKEEVHVFDVHENPNDLCIVGRHIRPVLLDAFREIEQTAEKELSHKSLQDCMDQMREKIDKKQIQ